MRDRGGDTACGAVRLRLSPLRKLAREMADNSPLDSGAASAIQRTRGIKQQGVRAGNWLLKEQANELLDAPNPAAPYLQLARVIGESGDENGAKRVLIEMEDCLWKGSNWGSLLK